ncbi:CxC2 domain-containing protein [Mycena kentingensis (nom. inval.)]|nr:CxC2 domain-containing protein [Mycena kentingensis (nom. inval.)]
MRPSIDPITVPIPAHIDRAFFIWKYFEVQHDIAVLKQKKATEEAAAKGIPLDKYLKAEAEDRAYIEWFFANNAEHQAEEREIWKKANERLVNRLLPMDTTPKERPSHKRKRATHQPPPTTGSGSHHHSFQLSDFLPPPSDAPVVTYVDRVSADNRRVYSTPIQIALPSPVKRLRAAVHQHVSRNPPPLMIVDEAERYVMSDLDDNTPLEEPGADKKLTDPRPFDVATVLFVASPARDVASLTTLLLRFIGSRQKWNGAYFSRCSLRELGLCLQLGHHDGSDCGRPRSARDDFVVLNVNGIHTVNIDFCGCYHTHDAAHMQLLKAGLYPATIDSPRTCATLPCLDTFQILSLQGKTTVYDFYASLEWLTNGARVKPPDQYRVFLRVARQYRHLMLLKRAGRGHDRFGVMGTAEGELALRCPACPRPGVNLPDDWAEVEPQDRYLYTLYIAMDACFHLKRRLVSSWARDPGLGTGWAYMIAPGPYLAYIASVGDQKEMSSCSGLAAIDHANDKFSRGYTATGVGMGVCARHEFILPTSVGDLQKGERYANMDYIFIGASTSENASRICRHRSRLAAIIKIVELARFVIPKMHIKGHILLCQLLFAIGLLPAGGQLDGEGVERPWSMVGGVAASTRASGSRANQLDDHWGFWNWVKLLKLASLLCLRHDKAVYELATQEAAFEEFSVHHFDSVPKWLEMVTAFESDATQPNPYQATTEGLTECQVHDWFEEEEAKETAAGRVPLHNVGPAEFMTSLLHVEDEQRRINLRRSRRTLNKSISRIRVLQATYMPGALTYLDSLKLPQDTLAELVPILPPSALPDAIRAEGGCREGLLELERQLRDAQCRSALAALRLQLHVKQRLLSYKRHHSRHQGANTRSRALVLRNENKILRHADKYQSARRANVAIESGDDASVA